MFIPVPFGFGLFGLRPRVNELEVSLSESRQKVAELERVVQCLERRVEKHARVLEVLQGLVTETHGMTEAELLGRVRQVETARTTAPLKTCLHCGKALNKKDNRCIYCGEVRPVESVAELL
jgi:hypothetical protein